MNELQRLGINPKPLSSIEGVEMSPAEYETFQGLADATEFVDQMTGMASYKSMPDSRKKLSLQMALEHFYTEAEKHIETDAEFKDLRSRMRKSFTENRRAAGVDGVPPHSQEDASGLSALPEGALNG